MGIWARRQATTGGALPMIPMRLIPHAELHIFPSCRQWVMVEAKEAFERITLEFLLR